jgi:hypothetical protein
VSVPGAGDLSTTDSADAAGGVDPPLAASVDGAAAAVTLAVAAAAIKVDGATAAEAVEVAVANSQAEIGVVKGVVRRRGVNWIIPNRFMVSRLLATSNGLNIDLGRNFTVARAAAVCEGESTATAYWPLIASHTVRAANIL